MDFGTFNGNDSTTIEQFLATGGGVVSGLDMGFGGTQLSAPNINNASAETTFFMFELVSTDLGAGDFTVTHDDGFLLFENGSAVDGVVGPTGQQTNTVTGFGGGTFSLLYVATNGNPSVLNVDTNAAPVPVPASLPLLAAGFGGLFWMRRRKAA